MTQFREGSKEIACSFQIRPFVMSPLRGQKHNPAIQEEAIRVATRLGALQAVYAYVASQTKGARAESTHNASVHPQGRNGDVWIWLLLLMILLCGVAVGRLLKSFTKQRSLGRAQ